MRKICKLEDKNVLVCDELDFLISIDDKFERADFVTMSNPLKDIAQLITLKVQGQKNAVALKYCPFCGESINFMNDI